MKQSNTQQHMYYGSTCLCTPGRIPTHTYTHPTYPPPHLHTHTSTYVGGDVLDSRQHSDAEEGAVEELIPQHSY